MSAPLGYFSDEERDFPDLNKCPDCETFFADLYCPICGKECPEDMRAGNRKAVKRKRRKSSGGYRNVHFIPWYYSSWFIILMLIFMPIIGMILLWSGYWKKHWKIIVTILLVLGCFLAPLASVALQYYIFNNEAGSSRPVNTDLSRDEYILRCETADPEHVYRNAANLQDEYLSMTLMVAAVWDNLEDDEYSLYYQCYAEDGGITWEFLVRDFRQDNSVNLIQGDMITVYGQVCGNVTVSNYTLGKMTAPCINMLYAEMQ